jgi:hypothetical protein
VVRPDDAAQSLWSLACKCTVAGSYAKRQGDAGSTWFAHKYLSGFNESSES